MKSLQDFIVEHTAIAEAKEECKSFVFDLKDIENAEEILKSLEDIDCATVDDKKVTVKVCKDNADKVNAFQEIMKQFIEISRSSSKNASDEQYAQKTAKLEVKFNDLNNYLEELKANDLEAKAEDKAEDIKDKEEKETEEEAKKDEKKD